MGFGPRLPENAPFTASQRAWLDGYIACWFSFESARNGEPSPPPMQTELGDFPWHDPTLSLEERLALAEGRKPERVLMAAMAQLDCGQCGFCVKPTPRRSPAAKRKASAAARRVAKQRRANSKS